MARRTPPFRDTAYVRRTGQAANRYPSRLRRAAMACAAGCTVLATGCLSPLEIRVAETDPGGWGSPATVAYDNRDTLSERTLYVTARLRNNFGYSRSPSRPRRQMVTSGATRSASGRSTGFPKRASFSTENSWCARARRSPARDATCSPFHR